MIVSEKGMVIFKGSTAELYADFACLFSKMRKNVHFDLDEFIDETLEDSRKSHDDFVSEIMESENELEALMKELKEFLERE